MSKCNNINIFIYKYINNLLYINIGTIYNMLYFKHYDIYNLIIPNFRILYIIFIIIIFHVRIIIL